MSVPMFLIFFGLLAVLPVLCAILAVLLYCAARTETHRDRGVSRFDDGCYDSVTRPQPSATWHDFHDRRRQLAFRAGLS